jgi:membrane associated rhomboid family serine protease
MGIADRDYYKSDRQPRRGRPDLVRRGWSVNTWLIVICVAVFALDLLLLSPRILGPRPVPTGFVRWLNIARDVDRSDVTYGRFRQIRPGGSIVQEVLATDKGPVIGYAEIEPKPWIESYLSFSTGQLIYGVEFWRLLGFQFLHGNITHLILNMIGLFFFGPIVEQYLGSKRYLAFYLLCGIFGALMYLVLNLGGVIADQFFGWQGLPLLLPHDIYTPLVGASAGIFGVILAAAYLAPNEMAFLLFIPMRLATMAYVLVAIAMIVLIFGGDNAGGQAAHLGGAIAGWFFIRRPHTLHGFFDILGRADPTSHHYRGRRTARAVPATTPFRQTEVDKILDKITAHGTQSLTDEEKRILREASGGGR